MPTQDPCQSSQPVAIGPVPAENANGGLKEESNQDQRQQSRQDGFEPHAQPSENSGRLMHQKRARSYDAMVRFGRILKQ